MKEQGVYMKVLCIIPARGGSKRIPRKNIKTFIDKPILAYPIQAALESGIFDEVMVSTEDEEIAAIARQYGASVPFLRSAETASDYATTEAVHKEVLREYEKLGKTFDYMCNIYPCTPMVTPEKLRGCFQMLLDSGADCAQSMIRYSVPPQQAFHTGEDGFMYFVNPDLAYERTQDLEPWYYDAGQYYFFDVKAYHLRDAKVRSVARYEIPESDSQDIDTEADWRMAELKYHMIKEKENK